MWSKTCPYSIASLYALASLSLSFSSLILSFPSANPSSLTFSSSSYFKTVEDGIDNEIFSEPDGRAETAVCSSVRSVFGLEFEDKCDFSQGHYQLV